MYWFYFADRDMLTEHDNNDEDEVASLAAMSPDVIFFVKED